MTTIVPTGERDETKEARQSVGVFGTLTSILNASSLVATHNGGKRGNRTRSRMSGSGSRKISFSEQIWTNFGGAGKSQRGENTTRQRRNSILAKVLGKDAEEAEHDALVNQHMILPGEN